MKKSNQGSNRIDDFANIMSGSLTQSAVDTLTFSSRLEFGYSLSDNVGLVIHRIDYSFQQGFLKLLLDDSDRVVFGLVTSDQISSLVMYGSNVVDIGEVGLLKYGAAASGWLQELNPTAKHDYSDLPGGGLLVSPNPLFMAVHGVSIASVAVISYRIFYTAVTLNDRGFRELWETWNAIRV